MNTQARIHRIACRSVGVLTALALAALLSAAPAQALSIGGFKNSLVTFLLEKISVPGQFEVLTDAVESPSDGFSILKGLKVRDAKGVWFSAESLSFKWSPSALLTGQVRIDAITITRGHLQRLPQTPPAAPAKQPEAAKPFEWPRSPVAVEIPKIVITAMRVSDAILPQAITFDASGALRDKGDEQSLSLAVKRVDDVSGSIDFSWLKKFKTDSLALKLQAREAAGGLVAVAAGLPNDVPASLLLDGSGDPAKWNATLDLAVDGMVAAKGELVASWLNQLGVNFVGTISPGPRLAEAPRLAIGEQARIDLDLKEDINGVVNVHAAQLQADALLLTATGTFDRRQSVLDLAMDVQVDGDGARRLRPMLAPLAFDKAQLKMTAKGAVDTPTLAGLGELTAPSVEGFGARSGELVFDVPTAQGSSATLSLVMDTPHGPLPAWSKVFGKQLAVEVATRRSGEQIVIETAKVSSAAIKFSATGSVNTVAAPELDIKYALSVAELSPLADIADVAASGSLRADGTARGPFSDLTTAGTVRLSQAVVNAQRLGRVDISHSTRIDERIAGSARLKMNSEDFGVGSASAAYRVDAGSVALNRLRVDLLGIKANGDVRMPARAKFPVGAIDFVVASLEPVGRLSGQPMTGRGQGRANFAAKAGGLSSVQAQFDGVRINDMLLQQVRVDAQASALGEKLPKLDMRLNIDELSVAGGTRVREANVTANGTLAALDVDVTMSGEHSERPVSAKLHAVAALDKPVKTINVDTLQARWRDEELRALQPILISMSEGSLQIDNLDLALPDEGRVRGWFMQAPEAISVELELAQLPLRLLKAVAATPISDGRLSGTLTASTARSAPSLDARLSMSGVRLDNVPADTGALAATLAAAWDGQLLDAKLGITGPFDPPISGHFRAPMALPPDTGQAAGAMPVPDLNGAIDARLDWSGELEPVIALLPVPDHVVAGTATIALRVAGTLNAPLPSGEVTVRDGRYENLVAGTIIDKLTLNSDFSDQQRVTFELTGTDGVDGQLNVRGVVLPGKADQLLDITATLKQMLLVRTDAATVLSSADMTIKSSAEALNVKGKVRVDQAEIRLLNPLPPSIVDLGEVRIAGQKTATDDEDGRDPVVPVRLDIAVEIPGQVFVRGRGLDSEWGGQLQIAGTTDAPLIDGRIESRRGVLELIGRAFTLQRGRVVFTGKGDIDPNLDLRLVREANDITGNILIEGTGSKPKLRFTSNPALPADEVLPRLLFGRSKQSLSGPEAVQLAAGLAALASGEESVIDVARQALGVDVLRIESGSEGSAGDLSVGRYATENIYVGAKQSLDGSSSSVVVEIELPKNFVVDSEVGQNANGSVGITWRRDF